MNDDEREKWVMKDMGLYQWWLSHKQAITPFIHENREELDKYIDAMLNQNPKQKNQFNYC